jgi:hypothetical protein
MLLSLKDSELVNFENSTRWPASTKVTGYQISAPFFQAVNKKQVVPRRTNGHKKSSVQQ